MLQTFNINTMKENLTTLLLFLLWIGTSAQQTVTEKNIFELIQKESDAFVKLDYDQWANTWLQNETATLISPNGRIYHGFEQIVEFVSIKNTRKAFASKIEQTNFKVEVHDKAAWTSYDESIYDNDGDVLMKLVITKILKNVSGEWKIIHTSIIDKTYDNQANIAMINQWIEARNTNDLEAALKFWPEDRHESLGKAFNGITEAFPDVQIIADDMFAHNDKVALRWTFKGTHHGTFQQVPATGKEVTWKGIDIYTITDGKIASLDRAADWSALMIQISDQWQPQSMPYYQQFSKSDKKR